MVRSMHRRASNLPFEKDQPGCMWTVFQLFHSHHRVNGRKPSEWSQDGGGGTATGSKYSKLKKHIRPNLYAGSNTLVEKQDSTLKKAHGYTSPGAQSLKNSPRLTRTKSIHHLECNDYVEVVNVDGKGAYSENDSAQDFQVLENFGEDYRNKPYGVSPLDAKMDEIFKNIQDPDHFSANYVQDVNSSTATSVLARSGSYPGTRRLRSPENTENCSEVQFSSYHLKTQKDRLSSILQLKDVKERLKDMTNDNKASQFITMDGIMDKVPYGHKISHDLGDQASFFNRHRWRSKSVRESAALTDKKHTIPHFSRSRSLTDSLDSYSAFLQSDSNTKLKPVHENGLSVTKGNLSLKFYGRARSLPEFLADFPTKDNSAILSRSASKKDPASDRKEPSSEVESSKETSDVVNQVICEEHDSYPSQDSKIHPSYCNDMKTEAVITGDPGKLSPQSVLDTEIEESTISPFNIVGGKSDLAIYQVVQEPVDVADPNRIAMELDEVKVQVDSRDEADFSYIVNVLIRSGFYGSGNHNSPELPLSPLVFKELEGLSPETEICTLDADIDLNHLLLFDLVDEVLSDMYDKSTTASTPRPSVFHSHLKPVPTGLQCLKEVWSEVDRHRKGSSPSLNHHISQDFGKKDRWMDRKPETEDVRVAVEKMIWDDLLEELVLGSLSSSSAGEARR